MISILTIDENDNRSLTEALLLDVLVDLEERGKVFFCIDNLITIGL